MTRLPTPNADAGQWGDILNDFLAQAHTADGKLKTDSVTAVQLASGSVKGATIADGAITGTKLDDSTKSSLAKADTAVQPEALASVATTGAYGDLTGKPTLGTAAATASTDYASVDHNHDGRYIRTVNGTGPDTVGNVAIEGGDSTLVQVGTFTLPATPFVGQSVTVLADTATSIPSNVTWDSGGAPTISTGRLLLSCVWSGSDWVGTYGLPFAAAPDTTSPSWSATLTTGTPTAASVVVAASALATDNVGVAGYEVSVNSGGVWSSIVPSGLNFTITGLTSSTDYPAPSFRAKDAAGNPSTVLSAQAFTTAAPTGDTTPPTAGTLTSSAITSSGFTLTVAGASDDVALATSPYAFSTDGGTTWTAYQASATYIATGEAASTAYTCQHRVQDAAGNATTGTSIIVTTTVSSGILAYDSFNRADSPANLGLADSGQTWVISGNNNPAWGVYGNQACDWSGTTDSKASIDVGVADMKTTATIAVFDNTPWIVARYNPIDMSGYCYANLGLFRLEVGTHDYAQLSGLGGGWASGDVVALSVKEEVGGTRLICYKNGAETVNVLDTQGGRPTAGTHGGIVASDTSTRWDDFKIESV